MLRDIPLRAKQALFLAAPQADANRAAWLQVQSLKNANCLHHHEGSGSIVSCSRAAVPGVEMSAEHHQFILLVCARNLGDGVVLRVRIVIKIVLYVQLKLHIFLCAQQTGDAVPLFH